MVEGNDKNFIHFRILTVFFIRIYLNYKIKIGAIKMTKFNLETQAYKNHNKTAKNQLVMKFLS